MFIGNRKVGDKCPACSVERDKGGRLELRQRKNKYLKCSQCKYTVHSLRVFQEQQARKEKRRRQKIFAPDRSKKSLLKALGVE